MMVHSLNLSFVFVCVLFVVSFSNADQQFEIVGLAECADCQQNNFKTSHAFSGLHVTIDCKSKKGIKRVGGGEVDEGGKFKILLPKGIRFPKTETECYAQLHSAAAVPCPAHGGVETAKIEFKTQIDKKVIFRPVKNLRFSTALCTSKLLWPFFDYPPLPKTDPWKKDWPKITIPPLGSFGNPWPLPPTYKPKPMFKPPIVPTYKPMPKPPAFKPAVPIYKPIPPPFYKPITKPPVLKPLPPPVPIYNKPPVPIYNKPPVVKPLPPPVPIYKPPVPIYKPKPLPPAVPIYKPPVVKSLPPPVPIYRPKPLPPAVPIYKPPVVKPLPPAVPSYEPPVVTKPLPPPFPLFPLPPLYKKKPCPPFTKIPPKYFEHPKFGYFPELPPFNPNP